MRFTLSILLVVLTLALLLGAKKPLNPYNVHEQHTHETPPTYLDLSLAVRETSKALKGTSVTLLIPNLQAAENIRHYTSSDGAVNIVRG